MAEITDLEIVDASNVDRFPENQAASSVNNGARELEGIIARWYNDINGTVDAAGTANVLTLAANQTISAYADGMYFRFTAAADNTDKVTLNVDSVGARDILLSDQSMLAPKALVNNGVYTVVYKATEDCFYLLNPSTGVMPRGGIDGLIMSNDATDTAHDIAVAVGTARDSSNELNIPLNTVITKRIDAAWTAGDDVGGYGSVSGIAADTWYHFFLIFNGSTTAPVVDAGFDASITATQLLSDSGYTHYRRIGSVRTDGSSNITSFQQYDDDFLITPVQDFSNSNPGTALQTRTLDFVPTDVNVQAIMTVNLEETTPISTNLVLTSVGQGNLVPSLTIRDLYAGATQEGEAIRVRMWTNTSAQIRYRVDTSGAGTVITAVVHGWSDPRGRNG